MNPRAWQNRWSVLTCALATQMRAAEDTGKQAAQSQQEVMQRVKQQENCQQHRLKSRIQICFYMPCLLLSPALPFAVLSCWNYSNPFSGQTFSNWLDISEELCCRNMKWKLSKFFFFSITPSSSFPAPFLNLSIQLSPKILTPFP